MRFKRFSSSIVIFALIIGCLQTNANAIGEKIVGPTCLETLAQEPVNLSPPQTEDTGIVPYASASLDTTVPANTMVAASQSFPLDANETVTINCSYHPASASVNFGLIAPNGLFYYVNSTNGSINRTVQVSERGNYTLAVKNLSSNSIQVVGFVDY